jgi:hypothetical protein
MAADALLSRLEKVKRTGNGTWLACCPAHADKRPSMSVREVEDGRVLVHCFAGCGVDEILGAVGLEFDALFPPKPPQGDRVPAVRRPYPAADVLEALADEVRIVALMAGDMRNFRHIAEPDYERLALAQERIEAGRRLALG